MYTNFLHNCLNIKSAIGKLTASSHFSPVLIDLSIQFRTFAQERL